jgi:hypothetical protein
MTGRNKYCFNGANVIIFQLNSFIEEAFFSREKEEPIGSPEWKGPIRNPRKQDHLLI